MQINAVAYNWKLDAFPYESAHCSQQFKAVPLDKRIFEGGALGVRHKEHIALTEPLPIKFATDSRVAKHAEKNVTMKEVWKMWK